MGALAAAAERFARRAAVGKARLPKIKCALRDGFGAAIDRRPEPCAVSIWSLLCCRPET